MISQVTLGDCMEGMKQYPDKYFDLAVVDPPYGLNGWHDKGNNRKRQSAKEGSKRKVWDKIPDVDYFSELKRISENQIIWGGNYFLDYLGKCISPVIWDKINGTTHFADGEFAWTSYKTGTLRIYKKHLSSTEVNTNRVHPTQKPVKLYSWIYDKYLPNGGKVIDTHLGSGSNRIAADKAGNIDFYGWEIDKDYYEAQEKRWKDYKSQLTMF